MVKNCGGTQVCSSTLFSFSLGSTWLPEAEDRIGNNRWSKVVDEFWKLVREGRMTRGINDETRVTMNMGRNGRHLKFGISKSCYTRIVFDVGYFWILNNSGKSINSNDFEICTSWLQI